MATKKTKTDSFKLSMAVNEKVYTSEGETVKDAINTIEQKVFPAKTKAVLTVEKDGRKSSFVFQPLVLRRLFANNTLKEIWSKKFLQFLK